MSTYEAEIGDSLLNLAADVDHFTRNMVPQDRDAPARKCATEAAEFAADPSLDEAADVLITVIGWCQLADISMEMLIDAATIKMTTNLARTWQQQPDGTWQHVDNPDSPAGEFLEYQRHHLSAAQHEGLAGWVAKP